MKQCFDFLILIEMIISLSDFISKGPLLKQVDIVEWVWTFLLQNTWSDQIMNGVHWNCARSFRGRPISQVTAHKNVLFLFMSTVSPCSQFMINLCLGKTVMYTSILNIYNNEG